MSDKGEAGEAYLDQLLDSMVSGEFSTEGKEEAEFSTEEKEETVFSAEEKEETAPDTSFLNDILEDEPKQYNNITDENGEDLTELLGMLAEHYEEEQENQKEITKNIEDSPMGMDEVFQDALSAVSYMENEGEELASDAAEIALEEGKDIDSFENTEEGIENHFSEFEQSVSEEELLDEKSVSEHESEEDEPKKKKSFRERFFHNIIDEKEAEKELAEREAEAVSEQEKEAAKEEKKKQAAEAKEEKERLIESGNASDSQVVNDYIRAFTGNPQIVPNYQVKWNSIFQEETLGEAIPELIAEKITPEIFTQMADESICRFEEEQ